MMEYLTINLILIMRLQAIKIIKISLYYHTTTKYIITISMKHSELSRTIFSNSSIKHYKVLFLII
jgi:hypothetical protein